MAIPALCAPNSDLWKMWQPAAAKPVPKPAHRLGVGPPVPQLVPQQPGTGVVLAGQFVAQPTRFALRKAHEANDVRVFDKSARLLAVARPLGGSPHGGLEVQGFASHGPYSMPSFKVQPEALSSRGTQLIQMQGGQHTLFSVKQQDCTKPGSVCRNFEVNKAEGDAQLYTVRSDAVKGTMDIVNAQGQICVVIHKQRSQGSANSARGTGSEQLLDVAYGVDWTAAVAIALGIQQVGAHVARAEREEGQGRRPAPPRWPHARALLSSAAQKLRLAPPERAPSGAAAAEGSSLAEPLLASPA